MLSLQPHLLSPTTDLLNILLLYGTYVKTAIAGKMNVTGLQCFASF